MQQLSHDKTQCKVEKNKQMKVANDTQMNTKPLILPLNSRPESVY